MFSGTSYYKTVFEIEGTNELMISEMGGLERSIMIEKRVINEEMTSATLFEKTENLSKMDLAKKLTEANNKCFQVSFFAKPSAKSIQAAIG